MELTKEQVFEKVNDFIGNAFKPYKINIKLPDPAAYSFDVGMLYHKITTRSLAEFVGQGNKLIRSVNELNDFFRVYNSPKKGTGPTDEAKTAGRDPLSYPPEEKIRQIMSTNIAERQYLEIFEQNNLADKPNEGIIGGLSLYCFNSKTADEIFRELLLVVMKQIISDPNHFKKG